jgi:serine/threonine-protein kinase
MTSASERQVGDVVANKYRLDALLGEGGMGVVFRATDLSLHRTVALKFVHNRLRHAPDEAVERLRREAQAVARLESDHVAKVHEVVDVEGDMPFLVMEHLEGTDLATFVEQHGPLPVPRAVDLLLQACEALAEAHVEGLIHRDLKPSNLFLCRKRDGTETVKVLDFGIVKLLGDAPDYETLTGALDVVGSIPYMAPEQLLASRHVTPRADIWSLGAVLFVLLTGRLPFAGTTTHEIARAIATTTPIPLTQVTVVPPEIDVAVSRCMTREPDQRFASVAELADALFRFGSADAARSRDRILHIWSQADVGSVTAHSLVPGASPHDQSALVHPTSAGGHALPAVTPTPSTGGAPRHKTGIPLSQLLLAAGLAFTIGAAAIFFVAATGSSAEPDDARVADENDAESTTKKKKKKKRKPGKPFKGQVAAKLGKVTKEKIVKAASRAGYEARETSNMSGIVVWVPYKGDEPMGRIQFVQSDQLTTMISLEACSDSPATYAQDGGIALCVELDDDQGQERELFDDIVK